MILFALWLGFVTIALAIITFTYFAIRAKQLNVHPFHYRGRLMIAVGIGVGGIGLVFIALHGAQSAGPDGISWPGVSLLATGAALWITGEVWERRAKKNINFFQNLVSVAEESKARMKQNGEEPPLP